MKITVIIPVYNESKTISGVLDIIKALPLDKEIIAVDDGSTDGTREILAGVGGIKTILHEKNAGKGAAIRTGLAAASGELVCIQDADLEYDPADIPRLVERYNRGDVDAVYGSRFLKENPNIYKRYLLGNKALTLMTNLLFGTSYTDTYTCYKLIRRDVFNALGIKSWRYEMEAEISVKLKLKGYRVAEIPVSYRPRTLEEGKKIGWSDAVKGVFMILKMKFCG